MSPEFFVAVSMAVICAAKNAAFDSEQRAVDLRLDVARQQLVEDLLRRRLVQVVDPRAPLRSLDVAAIGNSYR